MQTETAIIDSHVHILDPSRFPYAQGVRYEPIGAEQGSASDLASVLDYHGIAHALLVQPNSGYNLDNRCMLDAIAHGKGRFKGVAVVANDAGTPQLEALQAQGVLGVAMNAALLGVDFYKDTAPLLERVRRLGMFVQFQTQHDQLVQLAPMLEASGAQILIDHCGRPDPQQGTQQAGFKALLAMTKNGRTVVKLSGFNKSSVTRYPWADAKPFVDALLDAYPPTHLLWASDWPFLRAPARIDYGPLLALFEQLVPHPETRRTIQWETPKRLFGF